MNSLSLPDIQNLTENNSVTFQNGHPWVFWKITGLEQPGALVIGSRGAAQHGYTFDGLLLEERTIRLSGHIHGRDGVLAMYALRRRLNDICNPMNGLGTLVYENDAGQYIIPAFLSAASYSRKIKNYQTVDLIFECPNPFFRSSTEFSTRLAYSSGTLKWPLTLPGQFGINRYQQTIVNDGQAQAPLVIEIGAGAVNPMVTNSSTGEFVKVSRYIPENSKLVINSDPERLEVSLANTVSGEKSNAYGYLSDGSSPFMLAIGENILKFESDDNSASIKINLRYVKLYKGV